MNREEQIMANKLIANFMGEHYNGQIALICDKMYDSGMRSIEILNNTEPLLPYKHYHSSWDWLMPVVEKIESDVALDVTIEQYGTVIKNWKEKEEIVNNVADVDFSSKIEHVYDAVVKFIRVSTLKEQEGKTINQILGQSTII